MNKQSLTQSRVTNILEVAKREDLLHVVISTEDLKTMQNMFLDLQVMFLDLQIKLNAANEVNNNRLASIDSLTAKLNQSEQDVCALSAKLNQSEQNVGVLLAKLAELGETVFVQQFGRADRKRPQVINFESNPYAKALEAEQKQADKNQPPWEKERWQTEQKPPSFVGNIQPARFGFCNIGTCFGVRDYPSGTNLPFVFGTQQEAQALAAVLNSFVTKG